MNIQPHSTPTVTLEDVQQEFQVWRARRKPAEPMPETLWQQVFQLLEHYPRATVLRTLKLKSERLTKKLAPPVSPSMNAAPPFMAIPLETLIAPASSVETCSITWPLANGKSVTLQCPVTQLASLMRALLELT